MRFDNISFLDLLEEIVDNRGKTCPTADSGIPLIATNCVLNSHLYPVFEKIRYVDDETYRTWFRGHPKPGDMLFVTKGTPGRICWVPDPVNFCIAQDMVAIRANKDIVYPKFLFALLRSSAVQKMIENMHVGTLIPHFKKGDFDQLILSVPSDYEFQKKIGDFYFDLSQKINLNRQTNATLEAITQAIFKEWFIDFNFPGSNGVIQDSELGPIPQGWKVHQLGDAPTFIIDGDRGTNYPKREDFFDNEYCLFLNAKNVTENGFDFSNCQFITKEKDERLNKGKLNRNDIVLTTRGTVGNIAYYDDFIPFDNIRINSGMVIFRLDNSIYPYFLYLLLKNKYFKDQIQFLTSGSAQPQLPIKDIRRISFVLPDSAAMRSFRELMAPIEYSIGLHNQQTATLTQIRDTLLPKLMRGEIDA